MAVGDYAGTYTITQLYDSELGQVALPKEFKLRMQPAENNHYNLSMKLGNSMGGTVVVSESTEVGRDAVSAGPMRSTMMMPPPDIYNVEKAVNKIIPAVEFIYIDGNVVVFEGPKGSMRCTKEA